jgi:uncharacterized protein
MKQHFSSLIIGLSIIIGVTILAGAYKNRNSHNDVINVTGLGSKDFTSDLIVWKGSFVKRNYDLKTASESLKQDKELIRQHLVSKGVKESEMVFASVDIQKEFINRYDKDGRNYSEFAGYRLTQRVQIESKEVDKIEQISREITDLINTGVEFYSDEPEYYYTKLAELKIEMIAEATKDARVRAEKIAENSGSDIGDLKSAQMGVFQIVAQNSSEDFSWGGSFNTTSKMKTATITMKLQYGVK